MSIVLPAAVRVPVGLRLPDRRHAEDLPVLSRIIPARYFIEVLRGIILRGAGLADLWRPIAWLAFYTILIIGLAVMRFKKTAS